MAGTMDTALTPGDASKRTVEWRKVVLFCLLAFALFWIPFFGSVLSGETSASGESGSQFWRTLFGILGPYSPLIAAVLMRVLIAREGFGDAHLGVRRVAARWWMLAILLPLFWNGVQDAAQVGLGYMEVNWHELWRGLYRLPINLLGGVLIFIGEEFGWRSYLVEKLRPFGRWNVLLLSGVIWAVWHVPMLIMPNATYGQQLNPLGAVYAFFVFVMMGFIFGWLYLRSGSVWPCVLMHSYNNLVGLELFREAVTVHLEPTLLQRSMVAIFPIAIVWLIIYARGQFKDARMVSS
jgi:membrane protease YdiL (CAAX protease family)